MLCIELFLVDQTEADEHLESFKVDIAFRAHGDNATHSNLPELLLNSCHLTNFFDTQNVVLLLFTL